MKRFALSVAALIVSVSANAQDLGSQMGISPALYQKVLRNEILMSDAIDITRARNGIDITQRGNNFGPMSGAGMRELSNLMENGIGAMPIKPQMERKRQTYKDRAARRALRK